MVLLRKQDGFMLAGVVIAIVIISVALLGICSMFVHANSVVADSGNTAKAANYAQGKMEKFKAYNSAQWSGEWSTFPTVEHKDADFYKITTAVSNFVVGTETLVKVNVTVEWVERNGNGTSQNRSIQYVTLYSRVE